MTIRPVIVAIVLATLPLSGCAVGDGIAHVVKLAQGKLDGNGSAAPAQSQPAPAEPAAAVDNGPAPPAPLPAPRDAIQVEQLSPPHS